MSAPVKFIRFIFIFCLFILCLHGPARQVYPCWGSRPLAMGGAFTGVADDVNAVYWNPAGLAQLPLYEPGLTTMYTTNPDAINYDLYLAGAVPFILEETVTLKLQPTIGFAYTYNQDPDYLHTVSESPTKRYEWRARDLSNDLLHFSAGMYIYSDILAVGFTNKKLTKQLTLEKWLYDKASKQWSLLSRQSYSDRTYDTDIGILVRLGKEMGTPEAPAKMFSLGLLIQNTNRHKLLSDPKQITNYRPGLGFRPHQDLLLSLELYDARTEYFDKAQTRFGGECWLVHHPKTKEKLLAIRGGIYHANNPDLKAYTYGLGLRCPWWTIRKDNQTENVIELDYTLMRWQEAKESTHLISLGMRF